MLILMVRREMAKPGEKSWLPTTSLVRMRRIHLDCFRRTNFIHPESHTMIYGTQLVEIFGIDNVYILSAGWGLIRASFLTPNYDITFSAPAGAYNLRRKYDQYCDCNPSGN